MTSDANTRRSSLFEIHRTTPNNTGSSLTTCGFEPHEDEIQKRQKRVHYENTYQMEAPSKFSVGKVQEIIKQVLKTHLKGDEYESAQCSASTRTMTQEILVKVKKLNMTRFKIIVQVILGEKKHQDAKIGSRAVVDPDKDNFAQGTYENTYLFAVGIVYGIYYE